MNKLHRGSRQHILDWIEHPDFLPALNEMMRPSKTLIRYVDTFGPLGRPTSVSTAKDKEFELPEFCEQFCPDLKLHEELRSWWLPKSPLNDQARTPVWDAISTCKIDGRPGLLLVEAKAHEGELDWKGKHLPSHASEQSRQNHRHIARKVVESCRALGEASDDKVALDIESHYQLANRVAWSAKVAAMGTPVVLLYLGFVGDTSIPRYLRSADHWERVMGAYLHGKLPLSLPERRVTFSSGGVWSLLIRSRPVLEVTPP